jgi:putative aldouronate transport system permease protein
MRSVIPDIVIYAILCAGLLLIIFPFYNVILISFARYQDISGVSFYLWPKGVSIENYAQVFKDVKFVNSMGVAFFNVALGTALNLLMTMFAAYALCRRNLPFRRTMFYFCLVTMFFSGGLLPYYMVIKSLGLVNSIFVMTVPSMLSTFNMVLMRNYFLSLPESLEESARIDGAGEFIIMARLYLPLSLPIFATIGLFCAVAYWNDWWSAQLFIQNAKLYPLALLLRKTVIENSVYIGGMADTFRANVKRFEPRSLQSAAIIVSTIPVMIVYPFLQKYFTKGIMLGAIKE